MRRKLTRAHFERSIPVDLDDSDWEMRFGLSCAPCNGYLEAARLVEAEREIRTGRLMR